MSEFAAIIGVLVEVVAFIFNRIIDVVCLGCLLASLVFPWRWIEACDSGLENRISNNWREYCLTMFGITIFDFIVIPFTLCTFLSPLRWKSICLECGTKDLPNNMDIRCMLVYQGFFALLDVGRFAIGLITLASPIGRQIPVVRASCTVLSHIFYGEPEQINITSSYYDKKINDLFMLLFFNGITTIRDIFGVICLFLGILVPTTWKAIFNGIGLICRNYQYNYTQHDCSWDDMYTRLIILFIFQPMHALIDLICAPFAFSVIISPFRCGRFFTHIKALQDEKQEQDVVRMTSADYACEFEYHWSEKIRAYAIRTGCLCFSDVLMIPFLLPLWISCYRYSPIKESMNKDSWGFDELGLVFVQFSYFLSDLIIIVPLLPLLFLTRIRYKPVQALFDRAREENKSVVFDYNRDLYVLLIAQFGKLMFDILVLPFTLFVLIFFYRSRSVVAIFKNEHIWEKGVTFHCNVLNEFFVVLHDLCFMVPLSFVLLAIAPWRFVFLFKTKFRHLTCFYSLPTGFDGIDDRAAVALAQSDVETTSPNAPVPSVVDEIYSDEYSILEWRYEVWRQLMAAFVDFPFFALGLVVMFTLWRSCELYYHIHAVFVVRQRWRYGSDYNWRIRGAICNQFKDLLLDILCLIPFSFIVGTLYKLPKLILDLYGKTLGPPLQSASIFDTKELKLYLPETGGPSLLFFLRNSDSLKDKNSLAFDPSKPLKLQIVSSALWSSVEHAFGSSLASIGRSMFPMTLTSNNQESNYFSFSEIADGGDHMVIDVVAKDNAALLPLTSTSETSENDKKSSGCSHLVTLKLGKFKRSTMMKKLDLLSRQGVTMVNIQLESVNNQGANVVLSRCGFDMKELFSSLSATESVTQAEIPIEKDNNNFFSSIAASDNRSNNFVNSFSLVVCKIFVEIMIDLVYLFMFFGSILNPYRFFVLVKSLLESASLLPYRLSVTCLKLMKHADAHLLAYRNDITPALMTDIKNNYDNINSLYYYDSNGYNYGNVYSYTNNISYHDHSKVFKEAEKLYLQQYTKLYIEFEKALNFDGCEKFLALVKERYDFQDKLMDLWFKRMAANTLIVQSAFESPNVNVGLNAQYKGNYSPIDKDRANLAYWILDEEMISFSKKIAENKSNLEKEIEVLKANANAKANKKNCGIFNRSSSSNQFLIKTAFMRSCADIFALLMMILIFVTVVRALPFVKDLINNGGCSITRYTTKIIVKRHVTAIAGDLLKILKLFLYVCFIFATVVCIPSYLMDFWRHMGSLDEAFECARHHCNKFFQYICELLVLIFACKSFTIFVKSSLYAVLVPAACISESFSRKASSSFTANPNARNNPYLRDNFDDGGGRKCRFFFSFLLWVGLIVGAAVVSMRSMSIGENEAGISDTAVDSCKYLIAIMAAVGVFLFISVVNGFAKKDYLSPNALPSTASNISWSYILAIITGPIEFLQLAAVIMFFFWGKSRFLLGTDSFSSKLLVWGDSILAYHNSIKLATSLCIIWGIIVTFPVVISSDPYKKVERSRNLKKSQFYQFLVLFITRLFPVWIMATFMRASSCMEVEGEFVMSTATDLLCGGNDFWASKSSLVLLVFFIITSSILHSDDANLLNHGDTKLTEDESAKFSPIYTMLVRFCQVFILVACLGGFWDSNLNVVLGIVIAVSLIIGILPLTSYLGNEVCNLPCVVPIRSAGWFCVTWTAIICLHRFKSSDSDSFGTKHSLFIGWAVIYFVFILYAIKLEKQRRSLYRNDFEVSGLRPALKKFIAVCRSLKEETGSYFAKRAHVISNFEVFAREFENCTSTMEIANTLLKLEEVISPAKFKSVFLTGTGLNIHGVHAGSRARWRELLQNFIFRNHDDDFSVILPKSKNKKVNNIKIVGEECKYPGCSFYANPKTGYCSKHGGAIVGKEDEPAINSVILDSNRLLDSNSKIAAADDDDNNAAVDTTTQQPNLPENSSNRLLEYALLAFLINEFLSGLQLESVSSAVSRRTFTKMVSINRKMTNGKILRSLPQEMCWIIYSYMILTEDMKKVLLDGGETANEEFSSLSRPPYERLWIKNRYLGATQSRWQHAMSFFIRKKKEIKRARISSGMYEILDDDNAQLGSNPIIKSRMDENIRSVKEMVDTKRMTNKQIADILIAHSHDVSAAVDAIRSSAAVNDFYRTAPQIDRSLILDELAPVSSVRHDSAGSIEIDRSSLNSVDSVENSVTTSSAAQYYGWTQGSKCINSPPCINYGNLSKGGRCNSCALGNPPTLK